jgi:hypothetical protein
MRRLLHTGGATPWKMWPSCGPHQQCHRHRHHVLVRRWWSWNCPETSCAARWRCIASAFQSVKFFASVGPLTPTRSARPVSLRLRAWAHFGWLQPTTSRPSVRWSPTLWSSSSSTSTSLPRWWLASSSTSLRRGRYFSRAVHLALVLLLTSARSSARRPSNYVHHSSRLSCGNDFGGFVLGLWHFVRPTARLHMTGRCVLPACPTTGSRYAPFWRLVGTPVPYTGRRGAETSPSAHWLLAAL